MYSLWCPIIVQLAIAYDEHREAEKFRRQRLNVRERYERDLLRGKINHVPEDVQ